MTIDIIERHVGRPFSRAKFSVVSAAAAVIREEGPRAGTLKKIAARAGITEPAIFRHFTGVDGLFAGLFGMVEGLWKSFGEGFDHAAAPLARLERALRLRAAEYATSPDLAYLAIYARQVFGGYPELRARIVEAGKTDRAGIAACLAEAVAKGSLRDDLPPEMLYECSAGAAESLFARWVATDCAFDLAKEFEAFWAHIVILLAPKRRKSPALRSKAKVKEAA